MNVLFLGAAYAPRTLLEDHNADPQFSKNELSIETLTAQPDAIEGGYDVRTGS